MSTSALPYDLPWPVPLETGRLLRRYHRFLADIALDDGRTITAHCVNSGMMEGLIVPGARVWVAPRDGKGRKLTHTWVMMELDGVKIGTDTSLPNPSIGAMLAARVLPGFTSHRGFAAEQEYGKGSRIDFAVQTSRGEHLIEVKNIHLVYPDRRAYFPDSVSLRATKHLHELTAVVRAGGKATVLFFVQRGDVQAVRPSDAHDPEFGKAARKAGKAGVNFRALRVEPTEQGLRVHEEVPVDLEPYDLDEVYQWRDAARKFTGWERPKKQVNVAVEAAVKTVQRTKKKVKE